MNLFLCLFSEPVPSLEQAFFDTPDAIQVLAGAWPIDEEFMIASGMMEILEILAQQYRKSSQQTSLPRDCT